MQYFGMASEILHINCSLFISFNFRYAFLEKIFTLKDVLSVSHPEEIWEHQFQLGVLGRLYKTIITFTLAKNASYLSLILKFI